ncbi:hypothetical protein FBEOM_11341 [Fusarium beomiforme]|uniref:Uncharacterized protein n=1 Tax=Fusarium beomiforme TaxID=44412 RepID=A0A9P5DU33_9HYPO|nr:hypothetical protein FBEOM_11341 [Fusarium beomiforme]
MLQELRNKYSLHDDREHANATGSSNYAIIQPSSQIPTAKSLFENNRVAAELRRDTRLRQRRAKTVSIFRKVDFTWPFKDDISDRAKVMEYIQTLESCNDALLEVSRIPKRLMSEMVPEILIGADDSNLG